jgi:epoxyqueuosine reductase
LGDPGSANDQDYAIRPSVIFTEQIAITDKGNMLSLNSKIKSILKPYYVDYLGFADLSTYQAELTLFGGNIIKGYTGGISLGLIIPDSIVDHLPERADVNVACEYRIQGYEVLNNRLNLTASIISSYLNLQGYRTLPIPAADRTNEEKALPTVSHKMIAHIAGLGWIGKNCLLITPGHGPRLRLITILTDAPLETVNNPLEQRCGECRECVKICPVEALKGKNYAAGESREERFDFVKCQRYFETLKTTQKYAVCGLCLYICPQGKRK